MKPRWLILADDLTGACDTGAPFARHGYSTIVLTGSPASLPEPQPDVWVVSTGSRDLAPQLAADAVEQALHHLLPLVNPTYIYKKIDSTLRGNPSEELSAVMRFPGFERALLTPAFPSQGRIVRDGQLWVNGELLQNTPFAPEGASGSLTDRFQHPEGVLRVPLNAIRTGAGLAAALLERGLPLNLADAETDQDLQIVAQAGLQAGIRLWCGSAGLARALLAVTASPRSSGSRSKGMDVPWLVVAGSHSPVTAAQVARLGQAGMTSFSLDESALSAPPDDWVARIAACLAESHYAVLTVKDLPFQPGGERSVASALAAITARLVQKFGGSGLALLLTGGDTAAAVCAYSGCTALRLVDEIRPGFALGQMLDGAGKGNWVITKAGGFGQSSALVDILTASAAG